MEKRGYEKIISKSEGGWYQTTKDIKTPTLKDSLEFHVKGTHHINKEDIDLTRLKNIT
jgi:hypothetical protein